MGPELYEIDFLPVESDSGSGSNCGDAISLRLDPDGHSGPPFIVVIDSGYGSVGEKMQQHLLRYYGTDHINLMISTHPDADHINGLVKLVEAVDVDELWVHRPRLHNGRVSDYSNIESIDNLIAAAEAQKARVVEPFTGLTAFEGRIQVLGPSEGYYEQLLAESLAKVRSETKGLSAAAHAAFSKARNGLSSLSNALGVLPVETLTDVGETDPRNDTSVVTLISVDDSRLLFTGDAGMPALEYAATQYETVVASFQFEPLRFVQVPHHGSRRNVGPTILNRILGSKSSPHSASTQAFASTALTCGDHPRPSVINAFARRGCTVAVSEGRTISTGHNAPDRQGWVTLEPIPPLDESGDDE